MTVPGVGMSKPGVGISESSVDMRARDRWGEGLHQAVEAKEQLPIQNETITLASISYQVAPACLVLPFVHCSALFVMKRGVMFAQRLAMTNGHASHLGAMVLSFVGSHRQMVAYS